MKEKSMKILMNAIVDAQSVNLVLLFYFFFLDMEITPFESKSLIHTDTECISLF